MAYKKETVDVARKQGFVQGLRMAHEILRKAKNYQAREGKKASEQSDPDVKANHEHSANVLHGLCLKLQGEIQKASEK